MGPPRSRRTRTVLVVEAPPFPKNVTRDDYEQVSASKYFSKLASSSTAIPKQRQRVASAQTQLHSSLGDALNQTFANNSTLGSVTSYKTVISRAKPPKRYASSSRTAVAESSSMGRGSSAASSSTKRKYTRKILDDDDDLSRRKKVKANHVQSRASAPPQPAQKATRKAVKYDAETDVLTMCVGLDDEENHDATWMNLRFLAGRVAEAQFDLDGGARRPRDRAGFQLTREEQQQRYPCLVWSHRSGWDAGNGDDVGEDGAGDIRVAGTGWSGRDEPVVYVVDESPPRTVVQQRRPLKSRDADVGESRKSGKPVARPSDLTHVSVADPHAASPARLKSIPSRAPLPSFRQAKSEKSIVDPLHQGSYNTSEVSQLLHALKPHSPHDHHAATSARPPLPGRSRQKPGPESPAQDYSEPQTHYPSEKALGKRKAVTPEPARSLLPSQPPTASPNVEYLVDGNEPLHSMHFTSNSVLGRTTTSSHHSFSSLQAHTKSPALASITAASLPINFNHALSVDNSPFLTPSEEPTHDEVPPTPYYTPAQSPSKDTSTFNTDHADIADPWSQPFDPPMSFGNGTIDPSLLGGFNPMASHGLSPTQTIAHSFAESSSSHSHSPTLSKADIHGLDQHQHAESSFGASSSSHSSSSSSRVIVASKKRRAPPSVIADESIVPFRATKRHPTRKRVPADYVAINDLNLSSESSEEEYYHDLDTFEGNSSSEEYEPKESSVVITGRPVLTRSTKNNSRIDSPSNLPPPPPRAERQKIGPPTRKNVPAAVWPEGDLEYYCHQCRRKSFRLGMDCLKCSARYCNKCITQW